VLVAAGAHSPKKSTSWSPCCDGKLEQLLARGSGGSGAALGGCWTAGAFQDAAMAPGGAAAGTLAALQDRLLRRVDTPLFIVPVSCCAPLLLLDWTVPVSDTTMVGWKAERRLGQSLPTPWLHR
jgi:hypothetical protein